MTIGRYRFIEAPEDLVLVTVDGEPLRLPTDRSLLAGLLATGMTGGVAGFRCAIGQCQRCLCRVDGVVRPACMTYVSGGETILTHTTGDPHPDQRLR